MEKEIMYSDLPRMDINEEKDEVIVRVYISGIKEKDVELEVKEDFLKINISQDSDKKTKKKNYISEEWESSSFDGVVSLPAKVVPMLVHHSYDGKILEVRLKKQ